MVNCIVNGAPYPIIGEIALAMILLVISFALYFGILLICLICDYSWRWIDDNHEYFNLEYDLYIFKLVNKYYPKFKISFFGNFSINSIIAIFVFLMIYCNILRHPIFVLAPIITILLCLGARKARRLSKMVKRHIKNKEIHNE